MAKAPHDGRIGIRELIDFMERCANVLDREGEEESAFYFRLPVQNYPMHKRPTKQPTA